MKSILLIPLQLLIVFALSIGFVRADVAVVNIDDIRLADNYILVSDVQMALTKFTIVQYEGDAEEIRRPLTLLAKGQEVEITFENKSSTIRKISKVVILTK